MSKISRFAAAFGLAPRVSAEDKTEETNEEKASRRAKARERKADESDEDHAKRCAEEDEKDKAEDDKEKKGDPEDDDKNGKKGAKSDEEKCAIARADGVKAERTRWETVLSDPRSADRGISACHMLAGTDMGADVILSTLATLPGQAPAQSEAHGLSLRMAAVNETIKPPAPGGGKGPVEGSAAHTASLIAAAAARARGETATK